MSASFSAYLSTNAFLNLNLSSIPASREPGNKQELYVKGIAKNAPNLGH